MFPQKPVVNFTTWRGHTLLCTVIYCEKQKRFISVLKNSVLRVWTAEETNICKGQKVPVPYDVHSLVGLRDADPLIIFKNGAIGQLDVTNVIRYLVKPSNDQISVVNARLIKNNISIAYISTTNKGLQCHFICFPNVDSARVAKKFVSVLPKITSMPRDLCLLDSMDCGFEIMLLENDGQLVSGTCDVSSKGIDWKSYCKVDVLVDEAFIAMMFYKDHLVLVKQNSSGVVHCVAFSLKYMMQTHKVSVSTADGPQKVQLYEACDRLFLVAGEDLFYIPLSSNSTTLSHFVGCKSNSEISDEFSGRNHKKCWTSAGLILEETHRAIADKDKVDNFSEEFLDLIMSRLNESETTDHVIHTRVLPELIEKKKFSLIEELLSYCEVVPEGSLVNILSAYISHEDNRIDVSGFYNKKIAQKIVSHSLIEQIFTIQINDSFLLEQLRRLSADQALFLLQYLHWMLKDVHYLREKSWTRITQWIHWISLLLDAHFHNVIILKNKHVHGFLRELMSTVSQQYEFLENLSALQELLWISKQKSLALDTWQKSSYCIESLEFRDIW